MGKSAARGRAWGSGPALQHRGWTASLDRATAGTHCARHGPRCRRRRRRQPGSQPGAAKRAVSDARHPLAGRDRPKGTFFACCDPCAGLREAHLIRRLNSAATSRKIVDRGRRSTGGPERPKLSGLWKPWRLRRLGPSSEEARAIQNKQDAPPGCTCFGNNTERSF